MNVKRTGHARALCASAMVCSAVAQAGGFATPEQSGSGTGNAFAGAAAVAEDASTIFYNPAGMTWLPEVEIVNAIHLVIPDTRFHNGGSIPAAGQAAGGEGGNIGKVGPVLNLYLSAPLIERLWAGIGVSFLFGQETKYESDWVGRFQGIKSRSRALNINPSIAYKVNDALSVGAGFDVQRFSAELTNAVNYSAIVSQVAAQRGIALPPLPGLEGSARVHGHDLGYGYDVGALYQFPNDAARIGLSYRSEIRYRIDGDIGFNRPAAPTTLPASGQIAVNQIVAGATPEGNVSVDVKLPATAMLSGVLRASRKLDLLADVSWTEWSSLQEVRITRDNGSLLTNQVYGWRNTWRFSLGAKYALTDAVAVRTGVAYDQTPVRDEHRNVRLPDADKTWLAAGLQYRLNPKTTLDFGYAHVFVKDARIHDDQRASGGGLIDGVYRSRIDLLSAQGVYRF